MPHTPLVFALIAQPLMDYLQHKLSTGKIEGIKVAKGPIICHHLFADNVGIFILANKQSFIKLQEALRSYEVAFGAKLNLAKSSFPLQ